MRKEIIDIEVRDSLGRICNEGDTVLVLPRQELKIIEGTKELNIGPQYYIGKIKRLTQTGHGFAQSGDQFDLHVDHVGLDCIIQIDSENGSYTPFYRLGDGPSIVLRNGIWMEAPVPEFKSK